METKLKAAKSYLNNENAVWIANGRRENVLLDILKNKKIGTKITSN